MVRVAISSDNHLDINRQDIADVLAHQAQFLSQADVDVYLIVGDLFNDFTKTVQFVEDLQAQLSKVRVYFVAGNHDMGRHVTENELENFQHPNYLHNRYVDLPETNWRIIGLNGWYDYGFAPALPAETAAEFHRGRFYDRVIDQHDSDQIRYERSYQQLQQLLQAGTQAQKQMLVMTHFVPVGDDLLPNVNQPRQLVNAMMGSPKTGQLLASYPAVKAVVFGHAHMHAPVRHYGQADFMNVSVGIGRRNDWLTPDFLSTWELRLKILDLNG